MENKCYEIRLSDQQAPWAAEVKLWERVPTINGKTESWATVAKRLLEAGKLVACRSCGCRPGATWVEEDYVCNEHVVRLALELEKK